MGHAAEREKKIINLERLIAREKKKRERLIAATRKGREMGVSLSKWVFVQSPIPRYRKGRK